MLLNGKTTEIRTNCTKGVPVRWQWTDPTAKDGARDLVELIQRLRSLRVSVCLTFAEVAIFDATDFINTLLGNEYWRLILRHLVLDHIYPQCYEIGSRSKQEKKDAYILRMASPAFINNEITNTFGAYDQQDAAFHVKEILGEVTTLGGKNGKIFDVEPANKMRFTTQLETV